MSAARCRWGARPTLRARRAVVPSSPLVLLGLFLGLAGGCGRQQAAEAEARAVAEAMAARAAAEASAIARRSEPAIDVPERHVRCLKPSRDAAGALETAVTRWQDEATGTTLLLVGAVHIAETAYFERLQALLDGCDGVLFEGVGSAGGKKPSGEELERLDALRQLQLALGSMLGLAFQTEAMDYDRPSWKNADLDFETLGAEMKARKVALPTDNALYRLLVKFVLGFVSPERIASDPRLSAQVRRQFAVVLADADRFLGKQGKLYEVLIEVRNEAAMKVVARELAAAPGKRFALFYGAAHLPDFSRRLLAEGRWRCVAVDWLPAWTLPPTGAVAAAKDGG